MANTHETSEKKGLKALIIYFVVKRLRMKRRNKLDCKYWKPRGKTTHYCTIDSKDPIKRCFGVCKDFVDKAQK